MEISMENAPFPGQKCLPWGNSAFSVGKIQNAGKWGLPFAFPSSSPLPIHFPLGEEIRASRANHAAAVAWFLKTHELDLSSHQSPGGHGKTLFRGAEHQKAPKSIKKDTGPEEAMEMLSGLELVCSGEEKAPGKP